MKEIDAILIKEDYKIHASKAIVPPVSNFDILVKVKSVLITPVNILSTKKGILGLINGTETDAGSEVVSTDFCVEHGHFDREIVAWKLTPCKKSVLISIDSQTYDSIFYPLISIVTDAIDSSWGDTLIVSRGGLLYALYSTFSERTFHLYAGHYSAFLRKEPIISLDKLKESSWDTIIVLSIHNELVYEVFNLINDVKKVLLTPMYSCLNKTFPIKCSNCSVRVLTSRADFDRNYIRKFNSVKIDRYVDRAKIDELPISVNKSYTLIYIEK